MAVNAKSLQERSGGQSIHRILVCFSFISYGMDRNKVIAVHLLRLYYSYNLGLFKRTEAETLKIRLEGSIFTPPNALDKVDIRILQTWGASIMNWSGSAIILDWEKYFIKLFKSAASQGSLRLYYV